MRNTNKPLFNLTARDLMTAEVESIPQWMSLPVAARMLSRAHISGAPVVDGEGRCLGVISSMDFMTWAEGGEAAPNRTHEEDSAHSAWQMMDPEAVPTNLVRRYMTADAVTVPPGMLIGELAQKMVDAHIHRVLVVNEENKPLGIVSSTDVLAALATAASRKCQWETKK
jgi:CBS-domain-containing membrane protein